MRMILRQRAQMRADNDDEPWSFAPPIKGHDADHVRHCEVGAGAKGNAQRDAGNFSGAVVAISDGSREHERRGVDYPQSPEHPSHPRISGDGLKPVRLNRGDVERVVELTRILDRAAEVRAKKG